MLPWGTILVASLLSFALPKLFPWLQQKRLKRKQQHLSPAATANANKMEKLMKANIDGAADAEKEREDSMAMEQIMKANLIGAGVPDGEDEDGIIEVPTEGAAILIPASLENGAIWTTLFPQHQHEMILDPPTLVNWSTLSSKQRTYLYLHPSNVNATTQFCNLLANKEHQYSRLGLTLKDVQSFHPVVLFPKMTMTGVSEQTATSKKARQVITRPFYLVKNLENYSEKNLQEATTLEGAHTTDPLLTYAVGKYNEKRSALYDTELFTDEANDVEGYQGKRIVHIGIDLYGPVDSPVYAFAPGRIAQFGYNAAAGDYGHVVIIEHTLPTTANANIEGGGPIKIRALYGHLSAASILNKAKGQVINQGDVVGWLGSPKDNGGWPSIHVHFQLSLVKPTTHDMPGVVSLADRAKALRDYPDPRLVLGWLYDH